MIVLVIPDTHSPFMHEGALDFLSKLNREFKPDKVIHLGDEVDAAALSRFEKDPDGMSAGAEHRVALAQMKPLYKLFPEVSVCISNHGARPFRKAFEAGIPRAYLKDYREFMEAPPKWQWQDSYEIDGVLYKHGEGLTGKDGAIRGAIANRRSFVCGHIHSFGGVVHLANDFDQIFGMNCGALIDHKAYSFKYAKHLLNKPTLGAGIIIDGFQPIYIMMPQ